MAMSLATPDNIRTLQRKLYFKAKAEPAYRFYLLYDKIHRADILRHAYDLVRSNPHWTNPLRGSRVTEAAVFLHQGSLVTIGLRCS